MMHTHGALTASTEQTLEVEQLLDNLTAIVIRFDANGRISAWNHAAEQALGLLRADAMGRALASLALPWTDAVVTTTLIEAARSESQVRLDDVPYQRPDGSQGFLGLTATPLHSQNPQGSSVLVLGRDITEQRIRSRKQLQSQKLEAIGQLSAGIAHEINTPAQYVSDNLSFVGDAFRDIAPLLALLRNQPDPEPGAGGRAREAELTRLCAAIDSEYLIAEVPRALQQALEGVQRISAIVTAMRAISPQGGDVKQLADLNQAAHDVATISSNEWRFDADLRFDLDPALPKVFCKLGDVNQAILNLVVNASQAIKEARTTRDAAKGLIIIGTRVEGEQMTLWVEDTGVGIPEKVRDRIFDPFFTTKPLGQGTGQGLSFAHAVIVDEHGGSLEVESTAGPGTRFTIRLPLPSTGSAAAP